MLARKPRWWTDAQGDAYVALTCGDHIERYAVGSRVFRRQVQHLYGMTYGFLDDSGNHRVGRISKETLDGAIDEMQNLAGFGPKHEPASRENAVR